MNLFEEKTLRIESAKMGAEIALSKLGLIKDDISQREAFRLFGEGNVRSWVNQNIVKRIKLGKFNSKASFSRIELETIKSIKEKDKQK